MLAPSCVLDARRIGNNTRDQHEAESLGSEFAGRAALALCAEISGVAQWIMRLLAGGFDVSNRTSACPDAVTGLDGSPILLERAP